MPESQTPFIDGEKIPDETFDDIYQPPPGFEPPLLQSHLIIGARGSGKTTLLRHLKRQHEQRDSGIALHISLAGVLPEHARDLGYGSLSFHIPRNQAQLLEARTVSFLAIKLSRLLAEKNVPPPTPELRACLPKSCRQMIEQGKELDWDSLLSSLSNEPAFSFAGEPAEDNFVSLINELGRRTANTHGPLLLLFDRADQVSPAALPPIFWLLCQSASYRAVIAMRPGHTGELLEELVLRNIITLTY